MTFVNKLLDIIYPPVCGFCNQINYNFLCSKCEKNIQELKINNIDKYNKKDTFFKEHYYIFKYDNEIRNYIIEYKFNEKSYLYKTFSKIITQDNMFIKFAEKYDCIISVPIHKKRMNLRGYNQSKLIAKDVASFLKKDYYNNVLIKSENSLPQSTLNKSNRLNNVKNVFAINNYQNIVNKNVIIFDDIFTTGATANECAKIIKKAGAKNIGIVTLAKD